MSYEEDEEGFEHTLLVVREVHVYKIPPRLSSGGYKCSEWLVSDKIWTGRLRLVSMNDKCEIRLEDSNTGELFAACPVYAGKRESTIENVVDSSRYFVLRIDDGKGRRAFIGLGFNERSESFDFNVAISDYEKHFTLKSKQANESLSSSGAPSSSSAPSPALNLKLKEGETIRINVNTRNSPSSSSSFSHSGSSFDSKPKSDKKTSISLLAPPPGDSKLRKPLPSKNLPTSQSAPRVSTSNPTTKPHASQGAKPAGNFLDASELQKKLNNLEINEKSPNAPASGWAMF